MQHQNVPILLILCCRALVLRVTVQEEILYITPAPLSLSLHCSVCKPTVHLLHDQPKRVAPAVHHPFNWSFALNSITDGACKQLVCIV